MSAKTALVTGAYRGLGMETARQLLQKGYDVILTSRRAPDGKKSAEILAQETKGNIYFVVMDVNDPSLLASAAEQVAGLVDHLDVLVNNAGIFPDPSKTIVDTPPEMLRDAFETNTIGPLLVARAFTPLLKKAKPGPARIINVSSGMGALADMGNSCPAYSISKTALNAVTRQLAAALMDDHIIVNSVCPGWCRTEMGGPNAPRTPEEGASGIVWLATDAPTNVTGKFWRDRQEIAW